MKTKGTNGEGPTTRGQSPTSKLLDNAAGRYAIRANTTR